MAAALAGTACQSEGNKEVESAGAVQAPADAKVPVVADIKDDPDDIRIGPPPPQRGEEDEEPVEAVPFPELRIVGGNNKPLQKLNLAIRYDKEKLNFTTDKLGELELGAELTGMTVKVSAKGYRSATVTVSGAVAPQIVVLKRVKRKEPPKPDVTERKHIRIGKRPPPPTRIGPPDRFDLDEPINSDKIQK